MELGNPKHEHLILPHPIPPQVPFFCIIWGSDSSKNVFAFLLEFLYFSQESIPMRSLLIQRFLGSKKKTPTTSLLKKLADVDFLPITVMPL